MAQRYQHDPTKQIEASKFHANFGAFFLRKTVHRNPPLDLHTRHLDNWTSLNIHHRCGKPPFFDSGGDGLDGPAIRKANRGDSGESIRENRFAEKNKSMTFDAIRARIASNLRFAILSPPEARFAEKGFTSGTLKRFVRKRRFARICESIRSNRAI